MREHLIDPMAKAPSKTMLSFHEAVGARRSFREFRSELLPHATFLEIVYESLGVARSDKDRVWDELLCRRA
ncbi:hypothetical protein SAMN05444354_106116 [Stigmatella aurantiaca]|uniref:Uncharacterized protein n=1 Tax=Stigmatella aurantiaca TaxID=41 RepID=A0A1H7QF08_STIAU|nr:hypothetical protein [Stigmatella aurantiaca]SEL46523.1 hypothetical protein SAMN05444354_106116 [Stigmatella aurantiaca]